MARPIRSTARRWLARSAICLVVAAAAPAAADDFPIYVDAFSYPAGGDSSRLRLVVRLPGRNLAWHEAGDSLEAVLRFDWSLHAFGERVAVRGEEMHPRWTADAALPTWLHYSRDVILPPGSYRLELRCRDLGRKRGRLGGLFGRHEEARFSGRVELRGFAAGGNLADLMLFGSRGEGLPAWPNPGGRFELGEPFLEVHTAFVPPREPPPPPERYFTLALRITDAAGAARFERRGGWRYDGDAPRPLRFRLPLAGLPVGEYHLHLSLDGPGLTAVGAELPFSITVGAGSPADQAALAIEAQLVLEAAEFSAWLDLPAAERQAVLRDFWRSQDSEPGLPGNATHQEFRRRFAMAQTRYGGFRPGALTDRGRMLVRYGEPDAIQVEVMPENRRALIDALRVLHGYQILDPGQTTWTADEAERSLDEAPDRELVRDMSRIGLGNQPELGNESEPFEVWIYELGGDPLLPRFQLNLRNPRLTVIFVDRGGYGDYELVYSSEDFEF
jgi:GWxTD domain-containing protein